MKTRLLAALALGGALACASLAGGTAHAGPTAPAARVTDPVAASPDASPEVKAPAGRAGLRARAAADLREQLQPARRDRPSDAPTAREPGLPADGTFVIDGLGAVYRVVGRSVVYVSTWTPFGGPQRVVPLTETMIDQIRDYPVDGTFITSIQERRVYRIVGGAPIVVTTWAAFGGKAQKTLGVDSNALAQAYRCQWTKETRKFCFISTSPTAERYSRDSSGALVLDARPNLLIRSGQDGRVFRIAGGAPLYVSSWTPLGGPKPAVTVDGVAIDRAGQTGPFRFMRAQPFDQTYVKDGSNGRIFNVMGGAPVYVSHPDGLTVVYPDVYPDDDPKDEVFKHIPAVVDGAAITRAGQAGVWSHLRYRPEDGITLITAPERNVYVTVDGAAEPSSDDPDTLLRLAWTGGVRVGMVGQATIDRAGQPEPWSHLAAPLP